jgi:hypothetical protein
MAASCQIHEASVQSIVRKTKPFRPQPIPSAASFNSTCFRYRPAGRSGPNRRGRKTQREAAPDCFPPFFWIGSAHNSVVRFPTKAYHRLLLPSLLPSSHHDVSQLDPLARHCGRCHGPGTSFSSSSCGMCCRMWYMMWYRMWWWWW